MVSPLRRPRRCSPAASVSTRSRRSVHVQRVLSSAVRTATSSGYVLAVRRNASAMVEACTSVTGAAAAELSMRATLPDVEALAGQSSEVVGEPDDEQDHDEEEPHDGRALHDPERDGPAADLL